MVRQDDELARQYIESHLGIAIADPFIGLLIERENKAVGAIVLNDYIPGRNIEVTAAADGPWSISDLRDVLRYCFARVARITVRTNVNNLPAIKRLLAMGFQYEGRMRQFFEDGDAAVFGLLKSEQRVYR